MSYYLILFLITEMKSSCSSRRISRSRRRLKAMTEALDLHIMFMVRVHTVRVRFIEKEEHGLE